MKSKKFLLNGLITLIMLSMLNCSLLTYATAVADETTEDTTDSVIIEEENDGLIPDAFERLSPTPSNDLLGLTERYDPRDEDFLTVVKDQGETDLCWMYSSAGAVEHYVSKKYGSKFDLSEAHGAVAMSNSINNTSDTKKIGYFNNPINYGGNAGKSLQYFTNWNTPLFNDEVCEWNSIVSEVSYPISKVETTGKAQIDSEFTSAKSLFNVTSAKYLEIRNSDQVKQAIKDYGGVITGVTNLTTPSDGADGELNFFRTSNVSDSWIGHAVMLVGWDDNYSKDNFLGENKPTIDGAWLVKNSYNKSGYYWLSYQEGSLFVSKNNVAVITGVQKATDNEHMLSYDYFVPEYNKEYYFKDPVYFCNVYDISDYTDTYNQINKVMLYLRAQKCTYEIKIAQLDSNGTLPSNPDTCTTLASGTFDGEGYLTAELTHPFIFTSNNKCAVFVKVSPQTEFASSKVFVSYEGVYRKDWTNLLASEINEGESYFGVFDEEQNNVDWNDCYVNESYGVSGHKGNLTIRPILGKSTVVAGNVTISPTEIIGSGNDVDIQINSDVNLFTIRRTSDSYYLKQDIDYVRTDAGVTLKADYINSLGGTYTELAFEFNNDTTKTVIINPKATITDITISGSPIVGDTLTATCVGIPEKDEYDVTYQWQSSLQGENWYDIAGATESSYTVAENVYNMYLRVKVTSVQFGNVVYPAEFYSDSTGCKVVILGDVDSDGTVSINDATLLQKYLNDAAELSKEQLLAADVDRNGIVNISDATKIQKMIVS